MIKPYTPMEEKLSALCLDTVSASGLNLYDLEYVEKSQTLRLFIENDETKTATLDDCSLVDRSLTEVIENADFIGDSFILEVSSPGVFRNLRSVEHFRESVGERVAIFFNRKVELGTHKVGLKRVIGILKSVSESGCELESVEELKDAQCTVLFADVKKANREPKWDDIKENKE